MKVVKTYLTTFVVNEGCQDILDNLRGKCPMIACAIIYRLVSVGMGRDVSVIFVMSFLV